MISDKAWTPEGPGMPTWALRLMTDGPIVTYSRETGGNFTATFMSPSIVGQLGYEPELFLQNPDFWSDTIHSDDKSRVLEALSAHRDIDRHILEYRIRHQDGSWRLVRDESQLIRDAAGEPVQIVGFLIDVTDPQSKSDSVEQLLYDFIETSADWFWESDADHRFKSISGDDIGIAKFVDETEFGKTRFELRGPDDNSSAKWSAHKADLDARRPFKDFQYASRGEDGAISYIRSSGKPIFTENGEFVGYRGTANNVTDFVESEERARIAQQRLAEAVEGLAETFLLFDKDDRLVLANRAYREHNAAIEEFLQPGTPFEDILRAAFRAGIYPDQIGHEDAWIRGRLERHRHPRKPFDMARKGGEHMLVQDRLLPDGGVVTTAIDVTDLKRREEKFLSLLDSAPDAMVIVDTDGMITDVNQQTQKLTGYERGALIGEPVETLVPKRFTSGHIENRRGYVESPRARPMGGGQELYCLTKGGEEVPVEISLSAIDTAEGMLVAAGIRDITDRKAIEDQLRQAQKMEAVGQLTGGVAHDFNNLLAVIMGNMELLQDELGTENGRLRSVFKAAHRGAELIHRMLAFSRQQPLKTQAVDLGTLIDEMGDLLRRTLGETIEVEITHEPDLWHVRADPGQLENALLNLSLNARDAMHQGGSLHIESSNVTFDVAYSNALMELSPGDYALITVSDTGSGMSPSVRAHALEPFFTTKDVGEGSGLGLPMVYGFVKQSGGDLEISSGEDQGTTVKLYLPRIENLGDRMEPNTRSEVTNASGETILVIEDEADVRELAEALLVSLGYRVLTANNGADGLKVLKKEPKIDLILSDVVLPGSMSGPDFVKEAKNYASDLKVIFMSGYAAGSVRHQSSLPENAVLLSKPFRRRDLASGIRAVLNR